MKSIYVGMSGGVDSSVAAKLLVDQGFDVTGVYMKNWTTDMPGMKCPWAEDLADAQRVAVQLDIPLKVFDFQDQYRSKVVDYMIAEYQAGRTPNPDIMCNQEVKFKIFLDAALEDGADLIATGHYARVGRAEIGNGKRKTGEDEARMTNDELRIPKDTVKDQTYFLYRITEGALARTLFPLGDYEKTDVRAMAKKFGLATAAKKDSQGICFVGKVGIRDFLSQYVEAKPGEVRDHASNELIGQHEGAIFYTLGQRHGLGIGGGLPYYVTGKDMERNIVYATRKIDDDALWSDTITLRSIHWISRPPAEGQRYLVRSRHRAKLVWATVNRLNATACTLVLEQPERALTPGQSSVLYDKDVVLGGGIVE